MGAESKAIYYCRVVDIMMQEELKNTLDNLTFARFMTHIIEFVEIK